MGVYYSFIQMVVIRSYFISDKHHCDAHYFVEHSASYYFLMVGQLSVLSVSFPVHIIIDRDDWWLVLWRPMFD